MLTQKNIEELLQKHFTQTIERITKLAPEIVFDDMLYQSKVIIPTYVALCASISGLNVIFPSSKQFYTQAMFTLRDDFLFEENGGIKVKEGSKQKIQDTIKTNFDMKRIKSGIWRWMVNKVLNGFFYVLSAIVALLFFIEETQGGSFLLGLIFLSAASGILFYELRKELIYPYSKKVNKFKREHLVALIVHVASYPFITLSIDVVGGPMFFISFIFLIFLKHDGESILGHVYSEGKVFIIKRLLIASAGALVGVYFSFGDSFTSILTFAYVFASLFFGFSITGQTRKARNFSGTQWATANDHQADASKRQMEIQNGQLPTITGFSQASEKNMEAIFTRIMARIMDIILAIPIGAIMIPYFIYHLVLKIISAKKNQ